jgi:hypothetical protein
LGSPEVRGPSDWRDINSLEHDPVDNEPRPRCEAKKERIKQGCPSKVVTGEGSLDVLRNCKKGLRTLAWKERGNHFRDPIVHLSTLT